MDVEFLSLRRQLDQAGYTNAALGIESVPLVRALFADLAEVKLALGGAQTQSSNDQDHCRAQSDQIAPLRRENSSLIQANNSLHADIIRTSDAMDALERETRQKVIEAQSEANRFRYLFNTQSFRVKTLETEAARMKRKIGTLLDRVHTYPENVGPVAGGPEDSHWVGPKQSIEISSKLDLMKADLQPDFSRDADGERQFEELLDIAHSRIASLEAELAGVQKSFEDLLEQKETLDSACAKRDEEICRLNRETVQHTISSIPGALDRRLPASHLSESDTIRQLNDQIDFLTSEMLELQSQLDSQKSMEPLIVELRQQRDMVTEKLTEQLQDLKNMTEELNAARKSASELKAEKENDIVNSKSRIPRSLRDLEAAQKTIYKLEAQVQKLQKSSDDQAAAHQKISQVYQSYSADKELLTRLVSEAENRAKSAHSDIIALRSQLQERSADLATSQSELDLLRNQCSNMAHDLGLHQETVTDLQVELRQARENMQAAVDRATKLAESNETLCADGHQLKQQLADIISDNSSLREAVSEFQSNRSATLTSRDREGRTLERQMIVIKNLQNERDQYRQQMADLSADLQSRSDASGQLESELFSLREEMARSCSEALLNGTQRDDLASKLEKQDIEMSQLREDLYSSNVQCARFRAESEQLRRASLAGAERADQLIAETLRADRAQRQVTELESEIRQHELSQQEQREQLANMTQHRDALNVVIREFESKLVDIQIRIQNLVQERDEWKFKHSQVSHELTLRGAHDAADNSSAGRRDALLRQVQADNSSLVSAIKQLQQTIQHDREMQETLRSELRAGQASQVAAQKALQEERQTKTQLTIRNGDLEAALTIAKQEASRTLQQIVALQEEIENLRGRIARSATEQDQLRSLCSQMDSAAQAESATVVRLRAQLEATNATLSQQAQLTHNAERQLQEITENMDSLRRDINSLDAERDRLSHSLDEKCEQVAELKARSAQDEEASSDSSRTIGALQSQIREQEGIIEARKNEINQMGMVIAQLEAACSSLDNQLKLKSAEINALTEDLTNMSKENQFVNGELCNAIQERDARASEAQSALAKVLYDQEIIRVQKREKEDLLSNYRLLCSENKRLLETASDLDAKCHVQLQELRTLHDRLILADSHSIELSDCNGRLTSDLDEYQRQNDRLSRSLATLHAQLDASQSDKEALLDDLSSTRSLSVGLENDRSQMHRRLLLDDEAKQRMSDTLKEVESRVNQQTEQTEMFRKRVVQLEQLLADERLKSKLNVVASSHSNQPNPQSNFSESSGTVTTDSQYQERCIRDLQKEVQKLRQYIATYEHELQQRELSAKVSDESESPRQEKHSMLSNQPTSSGIVGP